MKRIILLFLPVLFLLSSLIMGQEKIKFKNLADMEYDRCGMASITDGQFIYVFGGDTYSLNGYLDNIERYDPAANKWDKIGEGMVQRRFHNAEYILSENKIYIFNGEYFSNKVKNQPNKPLSQRSNTLGTETISDLVETGKAGNFNKTGITDIVEIIDLSNGEVSISESNPYPVYSAGSAVWENKIYVFGGWSPRGFSERLYEYDPVKDEWNNLPDMPEAKQTTGKIINGVLYTFGGKDNESSYYKTIHAYNIKDKKWELIGELPDGICANAIASDEKNIWLIGSYNNINFLASFDTVTRKITLYQSDILGRRYSSAQCINNNLYIFGGIQNDSKSTTLKNLQCADVSKYAK